METVRSRKTLITMLALLLAFPVFAHDKKKHADRAMIEKMEAVPCGEKERGLAGLGAVWGSVGVTHVNSDEKLCPQYLLRSDDMEYHVRPLDHKHPVILPVGQEAKFKVKKDKLDIRVPGGNSDSGKTRQYQVVAMKPIDHSEAPAPAKYDVPRRDDGDRPVAGTNYAGQTVPKLPPSQQPAQPVNSQAQPQPPSAQILTGTIVRDGSSYILKASSNSNVYQLDDQERAKQYEGKQVRIEGTLDANGNSFHVTSIELLS